MRRLEPFAPQFSKDSNLEQQKAMRGGAKKYLQSVRKFVEKFRSTLSEDVLSDQTLACSGRNAQIRQQRRGFRMCADFGDQEHLEDVRRDEEVRALGCAHKAKTNFRHQAWGT